MVKINWTEESVKWLQDIHDYIAQDSKRAAQRVASNIYNKVQVLKTFPEIGHKYEVFPDKHVRILIYGHYRIAYLIKDDKNIDILGIFHGALDIDRYLL